MARTYFVLLYRLDAREAFLIWYSDKKDGVVVDEQGRVLSFDAVEALQQEARARGLEIEAETPILHDLDATRRWSRSPSKATVDCSEILAAWNLFGDIRSSIRHRNPVWIKRGNRHIYDKIFSGNNLPAVTPPGEHYTPYWSGKEVKRLRRMLTKGLKLFRKWVRPARRAT